MLVILLSAACESGSDSRGGTSGESEKTALHVLTYRYYQSDQDLFDAFSEQTGIPLQITSASTDSLLTGLDTSVTDVVIASSVSDLQPLKEAGRLEIFSSPQIEEQVGSFHYKDKDGYWIGLTRKAAAYVYARNEVSPEGLLDYFALTQARFKGKVLASDAPGSPAHFIVAAMLAEGKTEEAGRWAAGVGANRLPESPRSDFDIIRALARGDGEVGIILAPSHIQLHMSGNPEMFQVGEATGVVFPANQEGATYIDLSCAAIVKGATERASALRFIEFLTSEQGQEPFARTLHEYPSNVMVLPSDFVINLGGYREARVEPARVAAEYEAAWQLLRQNGW